MSECDGCGMRAALWRAWFRPVFLHGVLHGHGGARRSSRAPAGALIHGSVRRTGLVHARGLFPQAEPGLLCLMGRRAVIRLALVASLVTPVVSQSAGWSAVLVHITISPGLYSAAALSTSTGTACSADKNSVGSLRPAGFVTSACGGKLPGRP